MDLEIHKPAPLKIGDRYHYTLSSYDPVSITVTVSQVTDADIDFAIAGIASSNGIKPEDIDDAWVAEHIDGASTVQEFRTTLRSQLEAMNTQSVEQSKPALCAQQLALRLNQAVPMDEIAKYRSALEQSMSFEAAQAGMDLATYAAHMGIDSAAMTAMLDDRAAHVAGEQAALSAYAAEKKLKVADQEIPALLGLNPQDGEKVIEQARGAGQLEDLRADALNMKAARVITSECNCTYKHESAEEAQARSEQLKAFAEMMLTQQNEETQDDKGDDKEDNKSNFKLV
ncbi:hypothetical protein AAK684_06480 [Leptogranulimonas caecicola]|jgi:FKBP-type peptidyl-prolyl cis-trans isomerase (trigger factor)|uniref:Trigger factor C-terminal domain-containing protein n=1 Tax=Leptogranulimonas caecicola TaxID=2894156 RepID=A0AAU9C281_9ACTN|nr:hypothetical protein [Leptogranulimonas caecicola]MCI8675428.1 hypothetical protein [Atopobiaceae bacterium]BCV19651.1 hypothetical protein ATOBIA_N01860 [Atopobiaceae bacterium P1]BDC90315.1 hypothetical protein ATTO_01870 [Leptogranulimonas caecicola]